MVSRVRRVKKRQPLPTMDLSRNLAFTNFVFYATKLPKEVRLARDAVKGGPHSTIVHILEKGSDPHPRVIKRYVLARDGRVLSRAVYSTEGLLVRRLGPGRPPIAEKRLASKRQRKL